MEDTRSLFQRMQWQRLLKLLIPCCCRICGKSNSELICAQCSACLPGPQHICIQCGDKLPATFSRFDNEHSGRCGACITRPPLYSATLFPYYYAAPITGLIQHFKFNSDLILARWFAESICGKLTSRFQPPQMPDCLIPVPLHPSRLKQRGFNQSYILARQIGKQLDIPVYKNTLIRSRATPKQSGLNKQARMRNLHGAFCLHPSARNKGRSIQGKHIAIIDDVITTGSTLREVTKVLQHAKPAQITLLAIAKTTFMGSHSIDSRNDHNGR